MVQMLILRQFENEKQCTGSGFVFNSKGNLIFNFKTLELPFRNNAIGNSSVPLGEYIVKRRYSLKYGHHFILCDTEPRSFILIHYGNYHSNTRGCILVGNGFSYINEDDCVDLINSRRTMANLNLILPNEFLLKIV